jgi:large subunit ribosomal protein L25
MADLVMEAEAREVRGKGGARTARRAGHLPGVVYGAQKDPIAVNVNPRSVEKVLKSEHGHNVILTLNIKGKGKTPAMIRDWQVDPVLGNLLHVDFLRVAMDEKLRVKVAVHFEGNPVGVKEQGGHLEIVNREVEIECLPGDIPEEFRVDVSLLELGKGKHVSDLAIDTSKMTVLTDPGQILIHVVAPRVAEEEPTEEEVAAAAEAAPTEPEVAKRGKAEEDEGDQGGKKE